MSAAAPGLAASTGPRLLLARVGWPALAALAPPLLAAAFAGAGATLAWRDTGRILAPVRPLVVEALRAGRLPLWNPHVGTGTPLLGDAIHGVLHPLSLLAALLDTGVDLLLLLQLGAAGLGAYLAARGFGASRAAAAAAGIGYGASGVVLGATSLIYVVASAATVPWVLAAARRAGLGRRAGVPLLGAALAATVLTGDVQAAAVAGALSLAVAGEAGGWRGLARAGGGAGLGLLLGAIQLWPTWGVMQRSLRVVELDPATLHQWALHPWRLVELVAPGFVVGKPGALAVPALAVLEPESRFAMPFLPSVVVGAPLVVAAAAGLGGRTGKLLLGLAAGLLWIALGHRLGAQQLGGWIPVWKAFRYAEKMVPHATLLLAILAARGADAVAEDGAAGALARRRGRWAALALGVAVAVAGGLYLRSVPPAAGARAAAVAAGAWRGLLLFGAGLAAAALWLALARARASAAGAALAAVALVHAAATAPFSLLAIPSADLAGPPRLDAPAPGPRLATPSPAFEPLRPAAPGAIADLARLEVEAATACYNTAFRVDNVDLAGAMFSRRFELLWDVLGEDRWVAYRRYGVTHVAVPRRMVPAQLAVAARATAGGQVAAEGRAVVFHAVPHRPWAFFAEAVRAVPVQRETLAAVKDVIARGSAEVVLETGAAPPVSTGRILSVDRRPERVVVEAQADGDGVLVVNDAFWPGWSATIDGAPAQLLPADVLVRAVVFPAGRHRLEMTYAPPEVRLGALVSALGLALALGLVLIERRRDAAG